MLALVQTGSEIVVSGGTHGSVTLNGVTAGDLLTALCLNWGDATSTFSASDGVNTWSTAKSQADTTVQGISAALYAKNVAGGNTTITVTASASTTFNAIVQEWSGADTASPLVAEDGDNQDTATTAHQASAAGVSPGSACLSIVCGQGDGVLGTRTPGEGYTSPLTSSTPYLFYEYQIFSSPPVNEHGSWTSANSRRSVSVIAAFKAASAAAGIQDRGIITGGRLGGQRTGILTGGRL